MTEGFSSIEEVAFVPIEELSSIEGFDEEVSEELRQRARQYLEGREAEMEEARKASGVSDEVSDVKGLSPEMLVALGENDVKSLDDLADLASDELREIVGEENLSEDNANEIIMAARAHWFEDEESGDEDETEAEKGEGESPADSEENADEPTES